MCHEVEDERVDETAEKESPENEMGLAGSPMLSAMLDAYKPDMTEPTAAIVMSMINKTNNLDIKNSHHREAVSEAIAEIREALTEVVD